MHKFHLLKEDELWKFTKEGESGDYFHAISRRLVLNFGHCYMLALEGSMTIHNEDGSIKFILSYPMPKHTRYYSSDTGSEIHESWDDAREDS
ncbi:MAG: hypothetical protein ACTIKR_12255 [Advenella sp.]|uniref:Uncharacterized protein n=1 Tax=Advenella kashmirensis TaxID=310575 RepID=A0A356LDP3_9BURK|nr:hypothetical protein [Advenella kashmirensis]